MSVAIFCACFACAFCIMWHISLAELVVCLSACFFVFEYCICNRLLALFFGILLCTACLIFFAKTLTFHFLFVAGFPRCHFLIFRNCALADFASFVLRTFGMYATFVIRLSLWTVVDYLFLFSLISRVCILCFLCNYSVFS